MKTKHVLLGFKDIVDLCNDVSIILTETADLTPDERSAIMDVAKTILDLASEHNMDPSIVGLACLNVAVELLKQSPNYLSESIPCPNVSLLN